MHVCLGCSKDHADVSVAICEECGGPIARAGPPFGQPESMVGRLLADKYLLLDELGSGAYGCVYRARQRPLDRLVAVKLLRIRADADAGDALRRFFAEARHTSQLVHPHNVKVHDFGQTPDGLLYIVMELVDGQLLSRLPRPMAVRRALSLVHQVCGAVAEAHDFGLVHRDLKPENIMVGWVDGNDHVRVLDYGIAKAANSSARPTGSGSFVGTPHYMSPEQIRGDEVDERSDIYSIGVILYELLAGHAPFEGDDPLTVLHRHTQEAPPPLPALDASDELQVALDALISVCLAKAPVARPQTMRALRAEIDALLADAGAPTGEPKKGQSRGRPPLRTLEYDVRPDSPAPPPSVGEGGGGAHSRRSRATTQILLVAVAVLALATGLVGLAGTGGTPSSSAEPAPSQAEPIAAEPIAAEPIAAEPIAAAPIAVGPIAVGPVAAAPTQDWSGPDVAPLPLRVLAPVLEHLIALVPRRGPPVPADAVAATAVAEPDPTGQAERLAAPIETHSRSRRASRSRPAERPLEAATEGAAVDSASDPAAATLDSLPRVLVERTALDLEQELARRRHQSDREDPEDPDRPGETPPRGPVREADIGRHAVDREHP